MEATLSDSTEGTLDTVDGLRSALLAQDYVADSGLATVILLARGLQKPVLLEGEVGAGKTDLARALTAALGTRLIRLQCYEGLDATHALYEWNYPRQLLHIRASESAGRDAQEIERSIFTEEYLIKRPLLDAISTPAPKPPVLLIDEVDRADEPFEAFLLEVLSEFQITIPELGTITAVHRPLILLTSNRTREIHSALRRRCLYSWLGYPTLERELEILRLKLPTVPASLAEELCRFVLHLRSLDLDKPPGIAETIDWAAALLYLGKDSLDAIGVMDSLGVVLKSRDDLARFDGEVVESALRQVRRR